MDDTVALAKELKQRGVDFIDCSCGGLEGDSNLPAVPKNIPRYNVVYSDHVRHEADMRTIVVGLITAPEQAEAILREGKADIVAIAREMLVDPYWPVRAAKALGLTDWLNVLPENYAFRLYSREQERRRDDHSMNEEIPFRRKG